MRDVSKLVESHLNVWAISDPADRAAELARIYTADVTIVEPDGIVVGRDALNARIGKLQEHFGGLVFNVSGSIEHHNDYAMYAWHQPVANRAEDVFGWDVLHFDGDLIDRAVMFIPGFADLDVPGHA
ncbi:nuclear transport factor 2 family protein [Streptomyces sp. NPDC059909]|uniref:nuclear transport factor 2 family protein n=1 Tax=Streptomyces sp. NPDC059909 TaxID=3346998 RepID=UPI0036509079